MLRAFRVCWTALKDVYDDVWILLISNALWSVISMPLLLVTVLTFNAGQIWVAAILGLLAVVPLAPATAGLYSVARRVAEGRTSRMREFLAGMRRYALASWRVMGAWLLGLVLLLFNIGFYALLNNLIGMIIVAVWAYLLVGWVALQIYLFPLLILMEQPTLRMLARNAALLAVGRPIFTLTTLVLMVVVTLIALPLFLPLFLIGSLLAQWSMRATLELVKESELRSSAAEPAASQNAARLPAEQGRHGQVRPK